MKPNPLAEVIAEEFPSALMKELPPPPHEAVNIKPRTKRDIIGFIDGESDGDDDEPSTDEATEGENEDGSDSIDDIKHKGEDMEIEIEEFTLPDTIEEVRDRFNQLYVEFMRHNKHEHTNELMFLLDEMLRQGAITPIEYAQLNTGLTEAADLRTDEAEKAEDRDDEEQNLMKSAVDYIIQHDKEELLQLMEELKDDIDEEFMDIVLNIEKLLEIFFKNLHNFHVPRCFFHNSANFCRERWKKRQGNNFMYFYMKYIGNSHLFLILDKSDVISQTQKRFYFENG